MRIKKLRIEYHIKTLTYSENEFIYGAVSVINNKPFDYLIGMHCGTKEETIENVTKMLIERDKSKLSYNSYVFKYDDIQTTRYMNHKFKNDEFYQEYSRKNNTELFAAPSVFLTDLEKTKDLTYRMNNYRMIRDYIHKQHQR